MDGHASHWLVRTAIHALGRLTHRGAVAADGKTGDGCGLLLKMPSDYMRGKAREAGFSPPARFAVGQVFLHPKAAAAGRRGLEQAVRDEGLTVAGWREVPVDPSACGRDALATLPRIEQIFVGAPDGAGEDDFERRLFVARRRAEIARAPIDPVFYVASLSARTLSYKGLVMPDNLPTFYRDLNDESLAASICVFHQRFSTNTWPQWRLAQPFRFLAHNGEINTIGGNRNWAQARASIFKSAHLPDLAQLLPLVSMDGSDSCSLDNMLEVLMMGGMDVFRAMRLLIPPAWQNVTHMDPDLKAFYEYNAIHMEPWDGPAGVVLSDGRYAACVMDRNGLRPARYVITRDRHITLASEIGVYDYAPDEVTAKGRLRPGEMLAVDTASGELLAPAAIDERLKKRHPYRRWLDRRVRRLPAVAAADALVAEPFSDKRLRMYEKMFGVSFEEQDQVIKVLARAGQEAVGSMGDDTPLPVLSREVRSPFDNFRQQFAQVTNPPIDPLRERIVMSLETTLGRELNPFEELGDHADRLVIDSPVLSEYKFARILEQGYPHRVFDLHYDEGEDLRAAVGRLCDDVSASVRDDGVILVVLSDRAVARGRLPIHGALACGAVHHRLIADGLRCDANLLIETGFARDPHHFAVLIGYGATAVYPYLAFQILDGMRRRGEIAPELAPDALAVSYRAGVNKGLYKILSKMGISTVASYRGAQLFEIVGLHDEVVELCFKGTVSRVQGARFSDLKDDQLKLAWRAWNARRPLQQGGLLKYTHDGEYHAFNPDVVHSLHRAVQGGDYDDYRVFADAVNNRPPMVFRDLLRLRDDCEPVALAEVESAEEIVRRFDTAGMSLGALSPEAHEALALAMNGLGGRSNSGEGGEDPARFGTARASKIKQVASGRFGVTPHYLTDAEVLQIKIAQGAKPGEGGQLPGHKVNAMIARLRYANPGIALISPPPHHDIYSIEDLAQLIFDLKQVNPGALVSVKLVAEAGVGTIAVGVAKAYADLITISGYDGGTGASPLTSIKYAGAPWELGLPETHQALRANNLRDKVRVQTDGGLKTGLDIVKAAILGADSFGFGTAPMVALGCKYLRICHLNNCATGVATQDKILRRDHFIGQAEMVRNYFLFVARETREHMAALGARTFEELIGRTELLRVAAEAEVGHAAPRGVLDLSPLLGDAGVAAHRPRFCRKPDNPPADKGEVAERMVRDARAAIENGSGGEFHYKITNVNRSIGARVSGEVARRHGNHGMADAPLAIHLEGTAGQSFGAWNAGGVHLHLVGDANDYVGKGMAGGEIVIRPPPSATTASRDTTIVGNTCLYGATGGRLFAAGRAGERFAVRNSGAVAVAEGVGDHGCEYMTGGVVAVLGATGLNFGAGMTGGIAWVLDLDGAFSDRYNHELVETFRMDVEGMERQRQYLHSLLSDYVGRTASDWGRQVAEDFSAFLARFWLIKPKAAELGALMASLLRAA